MTDPADAPAGPADLDPAGAPEAVGEIAEHDEVPYEHADTALPPRINAWRRRSATGAMLTGFAFGLREVFEPKRDEPSIVMETSGVPPTDLPVDAEVDQIRPSDNVVTIRPWLLPDEEDEEAAEQEASAGTTDSANADADDPATHDPAADEADGPGSTTPS